MYCSRKEGDVSDRSSSLQKIWFWPRMQLRVQFSERQTSAGWFEFGNLKKQFDQAPGTKLSIAALVEHELS